MHLCKREENKRHLFLFCGFVDFFHQTTYIPTSTCIVYQLLHLHLHLTKLPGFASFHAELLKPPKEHDNNEYEFAGVAPPPGKTSPSVCTEPIWIDLPAAAVAH